MLTYSLTAWFIVPFSTHVDLPMLMCKLVIVEKRVISWRTCCTLPLAVSFPNVSKSIHMQVPWYGAPFPTTVIFGNPKYILDGVQENTFEGRLKGWCVD